MESKLKMKRFWGYVLPIAAAWLAMLAPFSSLAGEESKERQRTEGRLSAEFTMERKIEALSDKISSKGRLFLGGPGLLRWETTSPAKSVLVINNGTAWIGYPELKVVKSFDIGVDPVMKILSEHLEVLASGSLRALTALYQVEELEGGAKRLVPNQPEVKRIFSKIEVAFGEKGEVSRVEMTSNSGDVTTISFYNVRFDPKMNNSLFQKPEN